MKHKSHYRADCRLAKLSVARRRRQAFFQKCLEDPQVGPAIASQICFTDLVKDLAIAGLRNFAAGKPVFLPLLPPIEDPTVEYLAFR